MSQVSTVEKVFLKISRWTQLHAADVNGSVFQFDWDIPQKPNEK